MKSPKLSLYDQVKEELENITKGAEDYSISEESPLAEFLSDMFYAEVDDSQIYFGELSDEAAAALKDLIKRNPRSWREKVRNLCELEYIPNIYRRDGEILSVHIGEQEHQIDSSMDVVKKIQKLSPDDFESIKNEFLGSRTKQTDDNFWFYTVHDYERFALIIDEDKLLKAVKKGGSND